MNVGGRSLPPLRHRFIQVHGRRVHYLRLGEGPPAVLVHSSPTNASYVLPQMQKLAARFTCYAFDTPGFGLSQPLPGDTLSVADLSQALADNMAATGLPPCPVFGTHTGAAITLSLAAHHPQRVTAVMLDAVPIFTPAEFDALFDGYFEPMVTDPLGGHYAATWTRFRDQYLWFPWTRKTPDRHNEIDLGDTAAVQAWVMNFFHAGRTYKPAYRGAVRYFDQAVADARAMRCPAVFTANQSDMLHPHLRRLPALGPDQEIRDIGDDRLAKDALIEEVFARWPAQAPAPADAPTLGAGPGLQQQFIDLQHGQVLLRHAGPASPSRATVLLLHDAPGSGAQHEALLAELATHHRVLAPDMPGCGGSDTLCRDADVALPPLAAWADAMAAVCDLAGAGQVCAYGIGVGASVALLMAERHPALVQSVVLRGLALPEPAERGDLQQRLAPPIALQPDGSHWYRTWLMLRDRLVWFPWYDTRAARLRRVAADFSADTLHDLTFEVMKQHASYHQVIQACLTHDAAASLAGLRRPLALCADPGVPFFAHHARVRALCDAAAELPPGIDGHAAALDGFLNTAR